jgi:hypothetical protein
VAPLNRAFAENFESEIKKRESISIIALPNATHKRLKTTYHTYRESGLYITAHQTHNQVTGALH